MADLTNEVHRTSQQLANSRSRPHALRFWFAALLSVVGYAVTIVGALMIARQNKELVFTICGAGVAIVLTSCIIDRRLKSIELGIPQLLFLLVGYAAIGVAAWFYNEGEFVSWQLRPADRAGICVITLIALIHLASAIKCSLVEESVKDQTTPQG